MDENARLSSLKGIGKKTEALFNNAGIESVRDLLRYYPRAYDMYEDPIRIKEAREGGTVTISGEICGKIAVKRTHTLTITSLSLRDDSGTIKVIWYRMPFLRTILSRGKTVTLRGRIVKGRDSLILQHPEIFDPPSKYEGMKDTLQPLYPLISGLTNNAVKRAILQASECIDRIKSPLPSDIEEKYHLENYSEALRTIHFPKDLKTLTAARKRLVFEEFLTFILNLRALKEREKIEPNRFVMRIVPQIEDFIGHLPFQLTSAQKKVWKEIKSDMSSDTVMSRLIQGDVGSGKTVIALLALMLVSFNGYQGAIMAPTEVLAKQHYERFKKIFKDYDISLSLCLLTGSMSAKEKKWAREKISSGEADIVVGTHALIQDKTNFQNLALVVTDEQHRFGVRQRESLAEKGLLPHILVMSATPIPRTLAIILYGDLDISVIDELPQNRLPVKNCVVGTAYRRTAYRFMAEQISQGHQCYIVCPMIEAGEKMEAENVTDYAGRLKEMMGNSVRIACLHGKMKEKEKDKIMEAFVKNEIDILVSTTVIEVGVDVPNATVMMIENAERFGLAQLHQLRGRVGRGSAQSYCIFMSGSQKKESIERLEILNKSNDGFYIASEDLKLRGPGDVFGIRQSGIMDFKLADIYQDSKILKNADEAATLILNERPEIMNVMTSNARFHRLSSI